MEWGGTGGGRYRWSGDKVTKNSMDSPAFCISEICSVFLRNDQIFQTKTENGTYEGYSDEDVNYCSSV